MNEETLQRARWARNGPRSWLLKCAIKDGGAVLARIQEDQSIKRFYVWSALNLYGGYGRSFYAAQRAARKALRESLRAEPFSLKGAGKA